MGSDGLGGVQWRVCPLSQHKKPYTDLLYEQCDTDLPSSLRMGKVEVSCEGWSAAGDKNVLQGSCGLEYNLHRTNRALEDGLDPDMPSSFGTSRSPEQGYAYLDTIRIDRLLRTAFSALFLAVLGIIIYSIIHSFLLRFAPRYAPPRPPWSGWGGTGGGGGGGGPGFSPGQPPPPYSKDESSTPAVPGRPGNLGGFWTGLAAGGAAGYFAANRGQPRARSRPERRERVDHDCDEGDRGVGPSTGGSGGGMRRATGFGGSTTR